MFIEKKILGVFAGLWLFTLLMAFDVGHVWGRIAILESLQDTTEQELRESLNNPESQPATSTRIPPYDLALVREAKHVASVLDVDSSTGWRIAKEVKAATERYPNLTFWLLIGVIEVESGGDPEIVSSAGAIGLMQIMPATGEDIARELGEEWAGTEVLYDVETNIRYGSYYLNQLFERFGDNEQAAIAAYNWGPNHISRRLARGSTLPRIYPGKVIAATSSASRGIYESAS